MATLTGLAFENSFARLHPVFYEVVDPTPLPNPRLVAWNDAAAALLDLDAALPDADAVEYLSGARRLPGSEPLAQGYAGHQFGVWVPELGDGRAFLLGEVRNRRGESWDLHLKGGGRTRWSRFGDGRSVLRSAIREYLAGEALHGLDIPTTRALCIIGSDLPVQRETLETAATIIRLAPSHVRFGTFEYYASLGMTDRVRELADHVMTRHFGDLPEAGALRYPAFFGEVCRRTARLLARWMAAGFAHGVMNTDNMSILGITLDFGPYGFLDEYDAGFICNHTDTGGQYAFDRQPSVGMWNCARLGEALMTLDPATDPAPWQDALDAYWPAFAAEYAERMRTKLGWRTERPEDAELVRDLLTAMQREPTDYTGFFRGLSAGETPPGSSLGAWLDRYRARLAAEGGDAGERAERMRRVNPKYVLRNWVAQEAIAAAENGNPSLVDALRRVLSNPGEDHPGMERFAEPPGPEARSIEVSCSS